jgi:hypothetical protein
MICETWGSIPDIVIKFSLVPKRTEYSNTNSDEYDFRNALNNTIWEIFNPKTFHSCGLSSSIHPVPLYELIQNCRALQVCISILTRI